MVKNSPSIDEVLPRFYDFLDDNLFVAHNATFDYNFLKQNFQKNNLILKSQTLITNNYILKITKNLNLYNVNLVIRQLIEKNQLILHFLL